MSPEVEFIRRSLVAFQGGGPLPPDIARRWETGLRAILKDPATRLDDALGIRPRPGKRSISFDATKQERDDLLRLHFEQHHDGRSAHEASKVISCNLDQLREGCATRSNGVVEICYVDLFDKLSALRSPIPKQRQLYRLLLRFTMS